jgi:hypothetical protein
LTLSQSPAISEYQALDELIREARLYRLGGLIALLRVASQVRCLYCQEWVGGTHDHSSRSYIVPRDSKCSKRNGEHGFSAPYPLAPVQRAVADTTNYSRIVPLCPL